MKRFRLNSNQETGTDYRMRNSLHAKIEKPEERLGGLPTGPFHEAGNGPLTRRLPASSSASAADPCCELVNSTKRENQVKEEG